MPTTPKTTKTAKTGDPSVKKTAIVPYDRELPYNSLPLLPVSVELRADIEIMEAVIESRALLAEVKGLVETLPNPDILINNLVLLESQASSAVENIFTTADELYQGVIATPAERISPAYKEVERYRHALYVGLEQMQGPSKAVSRGRAKQTNVIDISLMQKINEVVYPERSGRIRGQNAGVRIIDGMGRTIYTPPTGTTVAGHEKLINQLLTNTCTYLNQGQGDPLIRLALAHYQFEAIHPFMDGNGRTGRLLNSLFLVQQGLLQHPLLYLSRYILEMKPQYYSGLAAVSSRRAYKEWVLFMLRGIAETAAFTLSLIKDIRLAMIEATELVKTKLPRNYNPDFLQHLFSQPYTRPHAVRQAMKWTYPTVAKHLERYGALGLVKQRGEIYVNQPLIAVFHKYGLD